MKPVEFKLIMNTSRSAEACTVEIKGSNRQVSLCHFKGEVSCEIVKKKKKKKKWQEAPSDNLLLSGRYHEWSLMALAITHVFKETEE